MKNKKLFLSIFLLVIPILTITLTAQTSQRYYWVGGGANNNWGTLANWSNTSGGLPAAGITTAPTNVNTVVFDQNSFLGGDSVVVIDGAVQCDSLLVENCTKKPCFDFGNNSVNNISINGSMFLQRGTILTRTYYSSHTILRFVSSRPAETLFTDSVIMPVYSSILIHGGNTTFWHLQNYTEFYSLTINDGSVDMIANLHLKCNGSFSYSGNGNVDLYSANITCNSFSLSGNGNYNLNNTNINVKSVGNSFSLSGQGNFNLDNTYIYANSTINVSIIGNGIISFINANIDCNAWTKSGTSIITAMQSANSLIRIRSSLSGGAGNTYHNVECYNMVADHGISNGIYNKISVLAGNSSMNSITTDSLLLQSGRTNNTQGTRVNNYFEAKPQTCGGQLRLYSTNTTFSSALTLGSNATIDIEKALIHDLTVSRPITAIKSYDWGNNTNITFTAPDTGKKMYWTGGTGDWGDTSHWRLFNGSPANCIPTLADSVFFDNTSSTGTSFQVRIDTASAYCNSMIWTSVPATSSLYIGTNNSLYINGSLVLCNTMSFPGSLSSSSSLYFTSNQPDNIIISNGRTISVATIYFQSISGIGGWKILDKLNVSYNVYFNSGHLDLSGYNVTMGSFYCQADNNNTGFTGKLSSRTIDFHNDTINIGNRWEYVGGQQITSQHSANSLIKGSYFVSKNNDYYHNVEHIGFYGTNLCNSGTSYFNKISFSNTTQGTLNNGSGTIYPDSLIFTTNKNFIIYKNLPIRKYVSTPILTLCDVKTNLVGSNNATLQMTTDNPILTDRVQVQNTSITDINITNGPYDVAYCDILGTSTGWNNIGSTSGNNNRYYWVGGTGNWSDPLHWADTSGGIGGSAGCIPTDSNTVVFDNNSFSSPNQYVYINVLAYCDSMLWIGADSLRPRLTLSKEVHINGSLELQRGMSMAGSYPFYFNSARPNEIIKTNGTVFSYSLVFDGTGSWTLLDSIKGSRSIVHTQGTLNFRGQYVQIAAGFNGSSGNRNNRFLDIRNSEIRVASWTYTGNLLADSSIIYCQTMTAEQTTSYTAQYNNVELNYPAGTASITRGKYNKVNILSPANINRVETDTLILSAAANYIYSFNDTLRVNKGYYGMGTPCKQIYLQSQNETRTAIFDIKTACANFSNDTLLIDNVYIHGIKAHTGIDNAKLKKGASSPDVNKVGASWGYGIGTNNYNQDWAAMEAYNSGGSTYFGEDKIVPCVNGFPDTLYSDNFLPSYGANFEWRKDSLNTAVIATTPTYIVNDSGTYYLTVDYGNGCQVTDDIHYTVLSIDSIIVTICYGTTYSGWNLTNLDTAGFYISRYTTSAGCDSLVYLTLFIPPQADTTLIHAQICKGNVYVLEGFNETEEGFYNRTTQNINGCDSVIELNLSYYPDIDTTHIQAVICQGSSYTQNGFNENQEGTFYRAASSVNGCDSVIGVTITFTDLFTDTIDAIICQGEVYNQNGFNETEAGSHQLMLQTAEGCDSLVVLNLMVNPILSTIINDTICEHENYDFFGQIVTDRGTYTHTLISEYGCDSIVELHLHVNLTIITQINDSTCEDTPYYFGGKELTVSGVYYDTLQSIWGCDSIIELILMVDPILPDFEITTKGFLCEGKEVELTAEIENVQYEWNTGSDFKTTYISSEGIYWVIAKAGLCQLKAELEVFCPCKVVLPNIFTPNDDGFNDVYIPKTEGYELHDFSMIIYNRWGGMVYSTNSFIPWDGRYKGKMVSPGVYYCVIEYSTKEYPNKKCVSQSSVTVIW